MANVSQNLKIFEDRRMASWDQSMLGDYCRSIKKKTDQQNYRKKSKINH